MADGPDTPGSPSVQTALDWATAVARVREGIVGTPEPVPTPMDLLVGAMLSHPDEDGEVRVLLSHFGLTVRDVVGEAYARVTPSSLAAAVPFVASGREEPEGGVGTILRWAREQARTGRPQLLHLVGGMLAARTELTTRLDAAFASVGESREVVARSYEAWLATRPEANGVAGRALRAWLLENHPRAPVSVAGFSTDDVTSAEQHDLVGISPEANALAYLVASRDLAPPLAIGLFGDWGSGKSFLMRDVRSRVRSLVALGADQPQPESAIWKNIQHIEFNAWEYVQGDLWAGLLEKVFQTLGTKVKSRTLVTARKEPIENQLSEQRAVVEQAKLAKAELTNQVDDAKQAVETATKQLDQRKQELASREQIVSDDAHAAAKAALSGLLSHKRFKELAHDAEALLDALAQARNEVRHGRALLGPYWRDWRRIALITAVVAVVPLVAWLFETLTAVGDVTSTLAGVAAGVPAFTAWLAQFTRWSEKQRLAIEEAQRKVRAKRLEPVIEAERALADAEARHEALTKELADQTATVDHETQRELELDDELSKITPGRVFAEFADKRSTDYRSQLGFLATVRADLRTVEAEISANNRAALGETAHEVQYDELVPNRIVLYIDDLDRCPPTKVVQVLEAVHLLLAFPLFVVFVAVDSRWLSSALIEELHALRVTGRGRWPRATDTPTARDYLEKIFQLPFWVQPLSVGDRANLVSGLLAPTVRDERTDAGPSRFGGLEVDMERSAALETMLGQSGSGLSIETNSLALTTAELEFIASLAPLLGDTPRRVKRFVNTLQFLLAIRPRLSDEGQRPPRMAAALLAAIHDGLPSLARQVFKESSSEEPLENALKAPGVATDERSAMETWLDQPSHQVWRHVAPSEIGDRREMVQRVGFDRPAR